MRIIPIAPQQAVSSYEKTNNKGRAASIVSLAGDRAELSGNAVSFSAALRKLSEEMQDRSPQEMARHKQVAREVRAGSYHIPAQEISQSILQGTRLDAEV